jgi:hypothetical protein
MPHLATTINGDYGPMNQAEAPITFQASPSSAKAHARVVAAIPARSGVGFKLEHAEAILARRTEVGWFEIHAENYMEAGGPPHHYLERIRERYPLSVHGVGMSIGGDGPLDKTHLARLKAVCDRYQPGLVSEHLAWSTHDTVYLNDLIALPYNSRSLRRVCEHIDQVQTALGRQLLLENPSTYVSFHSSDMTEIEFLRAVVRNSGCGLLLDVNNVYVSSINHGFDPVLYLDAFPVEYVREIHLGGHADDLDDVGAPLLIDSHGCAVADPVWGLYRRVLVRSGSRPTLIEWDNDVPDWPTLEAQATAAEAILAGVEVGHA